MSASALLPMTQAEAFAAYLEARGFTREQINPNHGHEALRLRSGPGKLLILYRTDDGAHLTVRAPALRAVQDFLAGPGATPGGPR